MRLLVILLCKGTFGPLKGQGAVPRNIPSFLASLLLPPEQQLPKRVRRSVQRKWSEIQANNCDKNKKWVQSESGERDGNQEMLISIPGSKFL